MDYKNLFKRILLLLTKPIQAWKEIKSEGRQEVLTSFVYPLLAISSLSVFLGRLFSSDAEKAYGVFQDALTYCCTIIIALFGGVYLSCFIVEKILSNAFSIEVDRTISLKLIGYSFVLIFLQTIIVGVLPELRLIAYMMQFYAVYILWEGIPLYIKHKEELRLKITLIFFFSIFFAPMLIQLVFGKLMNFMN